MGAGSAASGADASRDDDVGQCERDKRARTASCKEEPQPDLRARGAAADGDESLGSRRRERPTRSARVRSLKAGSNSSPTVATPEDEECDEERRRRHNEVELRRSRRIQESFDRLRDLLLMQGWLGLARDKASVLECASASVERLLAERAERTVPRA